MAEKEAAQNDREVIDRLAQQVLEKIPLGQELVRLGPRPLFIEFCGTPKSGKTSCADKLLYFLRKKGYNAIKMIERASVCPLPKNRATFNVWTACSTINQILESADQNLDIVILDRGIFDALCWMKFMEMAGRLLPEQADVIRSFLMMTDWRELIDIVFVMTASPKVALQREYKDQLIEQEGSTMNERTLTLFNGAVSATVKEMGEHFRKVSVLQTDKADRFDSLKQVARETLTVLNEFLDEKVLVIDRKLLERFEFKEGAIVASDQADTLLRAIKAKHRFLVRQQAEADQHSVQIIPSVVVEYDGKILLLRRKERDVRDRLHNKYAIWAGGHAREQDGRNGPDTDIIINALRREMSEELLIKKPFNFEFVGFAYDRSNPHSAIHLGVLYRVKLGTPEVSLAMDQQEFREKKGLSVSGRFFAPAEIAKDYSDQLEPWSSSLLSNFYKIAKRPKNAAQSKLL